MKQQKLAGFQKYGKTTRRAQFLAEMERIVPWAELIAVMEPFYPQAGPEGGRPAVPLERMHLLSAAVVQPVGSGGRGSAVRLGRHAQLRRHRVGP